MNADIGPVPVVETGAAQLRVVQRESQRFDQVQARAGIDAQSHDVARIRWNFGLIQQHVDQDRVQFYSCLRLPQNPAGVVPVSLSILNGRSTKRSKGLRVRDLPFLARRPRTCAGLYVSASTVALAVAQPGVERVSCAAERINGTAAAAAVLAQLVERLGAQRASCVLVAAPDTYQLVLIERPSVGDAELRDAARWRIQEYLEFPAADAVIDVFPFPDAATRGRTPMLFVVATARPRLEASLRLVTEAGLSPVCVDITELTLRNLVHRIYPSAEHSIALLRVTPSAGIINITRGDELFLSRRISGVPREFNESTWETFKDALLLQVQRSIDYYESALSQPPADGLLIAVSDAWQERIVTHLEAMLPLPVRALGNVLTDALAIEVFNPQSQHLTANSLTGPQDAAVAAALPALGAALRAVAMAEPAA